MPCHFQNWALVYNTIIYCRVSLSSLATVKASIRQQRGQNIPCIAAATPHSCQGRSYSARRVRIVRAYWTNYNCRTAPEKASGWSIKRSRTGECTKTDSYGTVLYLLYVQQCLLQAVPDHHRLSRSGSHLPSSSEIPCCKMLAPFGICIWSGVRVLTATLLAKSPGFPGRATRVFDLHSTLKRSTNQSINQLRCVEI